MSKLIKISKKDFWTLRKTCKSDSELAKRLSCSRQHVLRLRKKFDYPSTRIDSFNRNNKIFDMYKNRITVNEISEFFDLSITQVYRVIRSIKKSDEFKEVSTKR